MPQKRVVTTYLCDLCSQEYDSKITALICEAQGIAIPEFKGNEVVEFKGDSPEQRMSFLSGYKARISDGTKGIVMDSAIEDPDETLNPHLLPAYYLVLFPIPSRKHRSEVAVVSRQNLRKTETKGSDPCPICACDVTTTEKLTCYPFLDFGRGLPLLINFPIQACLSCNNQYLTSEQSQKADELVRQLADKPLANTQRLNRLGKIQY